MENIILNLLVEFIRVLAAIVTALVMRWLMQLSSPEQDMKWLERQGWYAWLKRLKWYRGNEWHYQQNFWNIVNE